MHPNWMFHFFIGGLAVSAIWAGLSWVLMQVLQLRDPRARVIVLAAPLVAVFVARVRLSGEHLVELVAISFAIAGLLFAKDVVCYRRVTKRLRAHATVTTEFDALVSKLAARFAVSVPTILISDKAAQPFTAGTLRPIIVLPVSVRRSLFAVEIEALLAHEMAHIKRRDFFGKWLLLFVTRLSWLNPIAPALFRRIGFEMECASDKLASQLTGRPGTLARTLVKTERIVCPHAKHGSHGLVMGACSFLESRVRLLGSETNAAAEPMVAAKVIVILAALGFACFKVAPVWLFITSF